MKNPKIAIFPGTFDPPHLGHVDVLKQASQTFDQVIWAILKNPEKRTRFGLKRRLAMMSEIARDFPNVKVASFSSLLVTAARNWKATHIVRSLRGGIDFDYEYPMTMFNRKLDNQLVTVYFPAFQEHMHISSTAIRQFRQFSRSVPADCIPEAVRKRL